MGNGSCGDCIKCNEPVYTFQKRVRITTFMDEFNFKDEWFHFTCWENFFKESVNKKVEAIKNQIEKLAGKTMGVLLGGR